LVERSTGRRRSRRLVEDAPSITTIENGWFAFPLPGIGWVWVALAKVEGLMEIVGLHMDIDPMWVTEADKHILGWPAPERRQWAIDNAPLGEAAMAVITADRLRRIPFAELRAAAAAQLAGDDPFDAFRKVSRQQGKALPDEHYQQVAEVYKAAVDRRQAPLKAVEDHWNVSRAGAAKYVKRARELGFLGWPERRGVPGYASTRSPIKKDTSATALAARSP
jgi:hypothetical protein